MLKEPIVKTVDICSRHPWRVLAAALVLTIISGYYFAAHFAINTDISKLISTELPWRQREVAFAKAFPKVESAIVAVVDGPTPELADQAAQRLAHRLLEEKTLISSVQQLTGGPFFQKNGFLFLSESELKDALGQLTRAKPLLEPLAADPSLRGVMSAITLTTQGVQGRQVTLNSLAPQFNSMATAIENATAGRPANFSWREMLSGQASKTSDKRQLIEIVPILDYNALQPGLEASDAIRKAAAELGLPEQGVTVRLTGPVPISDEEFGTLKEDMGMHGTLTILSVLVILWLALHSGRIIFAVFTSLIVGLAITAALGLAAVGAFNPISVAFFVLFVGIGVDFGLQFSVGYRAERFEKDDLQGALKANASNLGSRLALAAMATAAGFLAFTPTAYKGLSELGLIAGMGMFVALLTSITVLPAMLRLLNPPAEAHPLGYAFLKPVDEFMDRNRWPILVGTLCVVLAGLPLLNWLRFDFNPMNLRSPNVESVATYLDLKKDPETAGRTIEVLTASQTEADALSKKIAALPEVARTTSLSSFIPDNQDQKRALIAQTGTTLESVLKPQAIQPAPADAQLAEKLEGTSNLLSVIISRVRGQKEGVEAAKRLSDALAALSKASPEARARAATALVDPLNITLNTLRTSFDPGTVTLASLPPHLVSDWKTADGRVRISVLPSGDSENNDVLRRFVDEVTAVAPNATGEAIGIQEAGDTIVNAFLEAGFWALTSISILLFIFLRRVRDVALTLFPLLLACAVTLELCVILDLPLNFANIIALPLLLGVGVAFKIYYIIAWRDGKSGLLASPLTRAVFFSGMTTAVAFGSLYLSKHPGTSSMGELLALSLMSTMAAAVLFQPLLMGPPRKVEEEETEGKKTETKRPAAYLGSSEHTA
ncbi:hopanoid biosynthesis associated RND transporter like protein HpnN [Rhodomicrobium vannielii ATCC 17100]|uniref:Hopanoid biosynthesis associated RND transporter like protein HpnN n=1 Tax=Rhodomicrobium vannielii (strain ATCC 17100 / DSM 162 / LMG 4299 / NCIMB 10020 / ATH 3.1.1) TaxID=648757 RepID=E3I641_RHOVT|nr:MMPL family transporter [Rhodomicrobium vannielii]ADP71706.1 hopanoid biosynthesis associated RND transporter like protein HpnN [Rhodomicrobium vannielii ATCC 17100]